MYAHLLFQVIIYVRLLVGNKRLSFFKSGSILYRLVIFLQSQHLEGTLAYQ